MKKLLFALGVALWLCAPAQAQVASAYTVSACGGQSLAANQPFPLTMDLTGKLCESPSNTSAAPLYETPVVNGGPVTNANLLPVAPAIATAAAPSPTVGQTTPLSVDQYGSVRTLLMTPSGTAVDVTQPQPTYPYLSTSWTVNVVSCTSAGTVLALADSLGAAKQRSFVNVSGVTIYIGPASGVTATTGFAIPSGVEPSNPAPGYTGPVYCYAASTVSLGVSQLQ